MKELLDEIVSAHPDLEAYAKNGFYYFTWGGRGFVEDEFRYSDVWSGEYKRHDPCESCHQEIPSERIYRKPTGEEKDEQFANEFSYLSAFVEQNKSKCEHEWHVEVKPMGVEVYHRDSPISLSSDSGFQDRCVHCKEIRVQRAHFRNIKQ